jgi:hypothetical protein
VLKISSSPSRQLQVGSKISRKKHKTRERHIAGIVACGVDSHWGDFFNHCVYDGFGLLNKQVWAVKASVLEAIKFCLFLNLYIYLFIYFLSSFIHIWEWEEWFGIIVTVTVFETIQGQWWTTCLAKNIVGERLLWIGNYYTGTKIKFYPCIWLWLLTHCWNQ